MDHTISAHFDASSFVSADREQTDREERIIAAMAKAFSEAYAGHGEVNGACLDEARRLRHVMKSMLEAEKTA